MIRLRLSLVRMLVSLSVCRGTCGHSAGSSLMIRFHVWPGGRFDSIVVSFGATCLCTDLMMLRSQW